MSDKGGSDLPPDLVEWGRKVTDYYEGDVPSASPKEPVRDMSSMSRKGGPVRLLMDEAPTSAVDLLDALEKNQNRKRITESEFELGSIIIGSIFTKKIIDGVEEYVTDKARIAELTVIEVDDGVEVLLTMLPSENRFFDSQDGLQ